VKTPIRCWCNEIRRLVPNRRETVNIWPRSEDRHSKATQEFLCIVHEDLKSTAPGGRLGAFRTRYFSTSPHQAVEYHCGGGYLNTQTFRRNAL
jgi:hypothetical protein